MKTHLLVSLGALLAVSCSALADFEIQGFKKTTAVVCWKDSNYIKVHPADKLVQSTFFFDERDKQNVKFKAHTLMSGHRARSESVGGTVKITFTVGDAYNAEHNKGGFSVVWWHSDYENSAVVSFENGETIELSNCVEI